MNRTTALVIFLLMLMFCLVAPAAIADDLVLLGDPEMVASDPSIIIVDGPVVEVSDNTVFNRWVIANDGPIEFWWYQFWARFYGEVAF